jgi:hypothetical protein
MLRVLYSGNAERRTKGQVLIATARWGAFSTIYTKPGNKENASIQPNYVYAVKK